MNTKYNTSTFSYTPVGGGRTSFISYILDCDGVMVLTVSGNTIKEAEDNVVFIVEALNEKVKQLSKPPKAKPDELKSRDKKGSKKFNS